MGANSTALRSPSGAFMRSPGGARTRLANYFSKHVLGDDKEEYINLSDFSSWYYPDDTSAETWAADPGPNEFTYAELTNEIDVYNEEETSIIGAVTHKITGVELRAGIKWDIAALTPPYTMPEYADAIIQGKEKVTILDSGGGSSTTYHARIVYLGKQAYISDPIPTYFNWRTSVSSTFEGTVDYSLWYWYQPNTGTGYNVYKDGKYFRKIMGRAVVPEDADAWITDKFFDVDGEYFDEFDNGYEWAVRLTNKKFTTGKYNIINYAGGGAVWVFYDHNYDSEVEQNFEDVPYSLLSNGPD
jgi:hypothetical protein